MANFIRIASLFQAYTLVFILVFGFSVPLVSACYNNYPINCYENSPDSVICDIYSQPNTPLFGNVLTLCTEGKSYQTLTLWVFSIEFLLELPLNVSNNITSFLIRSIYAKTTLRINPLKEHLNMTRLLFYNINWNMSNVLSSYFPNLQQIEITREESINTLDNNIFRDLVSLSYLSWRYSSLVNVSRDCFRGLSSLSYIDLSYASISYLSSETFQHLPSLQELIVSGSQLNCTCRLQWMSIVDSNDWIDIVGECDGSGQPVGSPSTYSQCHSTESYQCFNKLVSCDSVCINTASSYICACTEGYGLTLIEAEQACHDIDECVQNTSLCLGQNCRNTLGSYQCYCEEGFLPVSDGSSCSDIDECVQNTSLCLEQNCRNTLGSYQCYCEEGFLPVSDGSSCSDIDECVHNTSLCLGQSCRNTLGSYQCYCEEGFLPVSDGSSCSDIDECSSSPCEHYCDNTVGSYMCSCYAHFVLSKDKHTCQCQAGYELTADRTECVDTNECLDGNAYCDHICINTNGSYTCACYADSSLTLPPLSVLFICISIFETVVIFVLLFALIITCVCCWKKGRSEKSTDSNENEIYKNVQGQEPKSPPKSELGDTLYLDEEELRGALKQSPYPAEASLYVPMKSARVEKTSGELSDNSRYLNLNDM